MYAWGRYFPSFGHELDSVAYFSGNGPLFCHVFYEAVPLRNLCPIFGCDSCFCVTCRRLLPRILFDVKVIHDSLTQCRMILTHPPNKLCVGIMAILLPPLSALAIHLPIFFWLYFFKSAHKSVFLDLTLSSYFLSLSSSFVISRLGHCGDNQR